VRLDGSGEVFEDVAPLLPTRRGDGHHPLDESVTAGSLRAEADLAPQDVGTVRSAKLFVGSRSFLHRPQ
jgi:hypothetical protein